MQHTNYKVIALLAALLPTAHVYAEAPLQNNWTGHVGGYLGKKTLKDSDWAQQDKHSSVALLVDIKRQHWPVSLAIDLFGTGDDDKHGASKKESYTAEAHIGLRKIFDFSNPDCDLKPYVGGGVTLAFAESKDHSSGSELKHDDTGHGYWLGVGSFMEVSENFSVGLDLRYSKADLDLADSNQEVGGTHINLGAVYHW